MYTRVAVRSLVTAASRLLGRGPVVRAGATDALARLYPNRSIALVDSGTSALTHILRITTPADGRTPVVALPGYACPDIATAAIGAGFGLLLYDLDPTTLEPNEQSLRLCLSAGATHVLAVHLFGRVVDVAGLSTICSEYGALLIEDAAQHAGGTRDGVRGGAMAPWSILSFGRGKGLNAGGGGAVLAPPGMTTLAWGTAEPSLARELQVLSLAAATEWLSAPWAYALLSSLPMLGIGATVYRAPQTPTLMGRVTARLLIDALAAEPAILAGRRAIATEYREALAPCHGLLLPVCAGVASGALREPVALATPAPAPLVRAGVGRSYPRTLHEYPAVQERLVASPESLAGAEWLARHVWTLPTHARVTPGMREAIIAGIRALIIA